MDSPKIRSCMNYQSGSKRRCCESENISHSQSNSQVASTSGNLSSVSGPLSGDNRAFHYKESGMWECKMCTLLDKQCLAPTCELCGKKMLVPNTTLGLVNSVRWKTM
ncbi:hypothetical protein Fmac_027182 [Flemingia macrophylla]|uniref:Uncharacterized protein n=1 Tax=Flemingia macrophylla TaxID=520843 RepID=A0ABD1LHH2_9FABA